MASEAKMTVRERIDAVSALVSAGEMKGALELLKAEGDYDPRLACVRGEIEFALERYQDAALSYLTVADAEPGNPSAQYNLALALQRSQRWDAAAKAFQRVLWIDRGHTEAKLAFAGCLLHLNRAEEALEYFEEVYQSSGGWPARLGRAAALHLLGRLFESKTGYEAVLAENPNSEDVLSNLIAINAAIQDLDKVREYAVRLMELSGRSLSALQGLTMVALEQGDNQTAARYCDRIMELAPGCQAAYENFGIATDRIHSALRTSNPSAVSISGGN